MSAYVIEYVLFQQTIIKLTLILCEVWIAVISFLLWNVMIIFLKLDVFGQQMQPLEDAAFEKRDSKRKHPKCAVLRKLQERCENPELQENVILPCGMCSCISVVGCETKLQSNSVHVA